MQKTTRTSPIKTKTNERRPRVGSAPCAVVTMGCPSGVGPELLVRLLGEAPERRLIIVGDRGALLDAARRLRVPKKWIEALAPYEGALGAQSLLSSPAGDLALAERMPGKPSAAAGRAQLAYVEEGYRLAKLHGLPLVTGPVSKEVIANSGLKRARAFLGHTEWLEALDGANFSVMCFASPKLVTSLVTTHIPIASVPKAITAKKVELATTALVQLCRALGKSKPKVVVCSLNPHAGEGELMGNEERKSIAPGVLSARRRARGAELFGPLGAETAYRKAAAGAYDAVVAMYHDQATIPMKLLDFGGAVNVTLGLSIIRTSVDHGTGYDIAGKGLAKVDGLRSALDVALRLSSGKGEKRTRAH